MRYRRKVDGIWHSDNGECSYRNCLPKSILLGLIGLSRGAKSALQRLHWPFPHTFFIPIYHQSNTPTANTCQNPRISPTWYVLLCAQWKFGLLMAFPSAERTRGRGGCPDEDAAGIYKQRTRRPWRPRSAIFLPSSVILLLRLRCIAVPAANAASADYDTAAVAP